MLRARKGFTLIELVIVIVILGILAAIAMPKFVDIISEAKRSATKGGLGAIRAVIALKYSKALIDGVTQPYSMTIVPTDFFDGKLPVNKLKATDRSDVTAVTVLPAGTAENSTYGWWVITSTVTTDTLAGRAGAYSDGSEDTSTW